MFLGLGCSEWQIGISELDGLLVKYNNVIWIHA